MTLLRNCALDISFNKDFFVNERIIFCAGKNINETFIFFTTVINVKLPRISLSGFRFWWCFPLSFCCSFSVDDSHDTHMLHLLGTLRKYTLSRSWYMYVIYFEYVSIQSTYWIVKRIKHKEIEYLVYQFIHSRNWKKYCKLSIKS